MKESLVYYTKNITSDSLIKIYNKLGVELKGKIRFKRLWMGNSC